MQLCMPKLQSPLDPHVPLLAHHHDPCFAIDTTVPARLPRVARKRHLSVP